MIPLQQFKNGLSVLRKREPAGLLKGIYDHTCYTIGYKPPLIREWEKKIIKNTSKFDTDADPFKIIWVNPDQIKYVTGKLVNKQDTDERDIMCIEDPLSINRGDVIDGDWDKNPSKFTERCTYKGIKQRWVDGIPWKETEFFKLHADSIEKHGYSHGCQSKKELLQSCYDFEDLVENIKKNGYKTQKELGRPKINDEIRVNVGRDGELLQSSGQHRLSAAKILGLEKIPIQIKARHQLWQEIRDDIRENGFSKTYSEELQKHPDLQELINN